VPVVLIAADLVGGPSGELADVKRVEAHLRVWKPVGRPDRFLIAGGHVDRHCSDRLLLLVGQFGEEPLQGLGVAAWRRPHDTAAGVVCDAGQESVPGAVTDLVDPDHHQAVQTTAVKLVGHDASEDLPDRPPRDPHQPGERRLGHLLRKERDAVFEVARVGGSRPRPRHHLRSITAAGAAKPSQLALDHASRRAEIQVPPAPDAPVLDL